MIFDFSFYLFVAVVFTGVVWLIDKWFLAPKRNEVVHASTSIHQGVEVSRKGQEPVIVEYSKSFFPVLLIVFLLRGFVVEPFRIPSGSMLPSLYIGDFILVNKLAYGIRLPVLNKTMISFDPPERGDVVVFRYPAGTGEMCGVGAHEQVDEHVPVVKNALDRRAIKRGICADGVDCRDVVRPHAPDRRRRSVRHSPDGHALTSSA